MHVGGKNRERERRRGKNIDCLTRTSDDVRKISCTRTRARAARAANKHEQKSETTRAADVNSAPRNPSGVGVQKFPPRAVKRLIYHRRATNGFGNRSCGQSVRDRLRRWRFIASRLLPTRTPARNRNLNARPSHSTRGPLKTLSASLSTERNACLVILARRCPWLRFRAHAAPDTPVNSGLARDACAICWRARRVAETIVSLVVDLRRVRSLRR